MNNLQIFKNADFGEIRTVTIDNEPWFVLKDVCSILGLTDTGRTAERLDSDELTRTTLVSGGQNREMFIVNESGLYNVILRSDKPKAKPFRKWVTSEVIPSIRKHGAYMTPETLEAAILNPDTMIRLCTALKDEQDKRRALEAKVSEDTPKVLFANAVETSQTSILIGDLAKLIKQNGVDIGQKRLFTWMRDNGYLIKNGNSRNMPTQKAMDAKLFEIKERTIANPDETTFICRTPKVTGKGQQFFINIFLSERSKSHV